MTVSNSWQQIPEGRQSTIKHSNCIEVPAPLCPLREPHLFLERSPECVTSILMHQVSWIKIRTETSEIEGLGPEPSVSSEGFHSGLCQVVLCAATNDWYQLIFPVYSPVWSNCVWILPFEKVAIMTFITFMLTVLWVFQKASPLEWGVPGCRHGRSWKVTLFGDTLCRKLETESHQVPQSVSESATGTLQWCCLDASPGRQWRVCQSQGFHSAQPSWYAPRHGQAAFSPSDSKGSRHINQCQGV